MGLPIRRYLWNLVWLIWLWFFYRRLTHTRNRSAFTQDNAAENKEVKTRRNPLPQKKPSASDFSSHTTDARRNSAAADSDRRQGYCSRWGKKDDIRASRRQCNLFHADSFHGAAHKLLNMLNDGSGPKRAILQTLLHIWSWTRRGAFKWWQLASHEQQRNTPLAKFRSNLWPLHCSQSHSMKPSNVRNDSNDFMLNAQRFS